MGLFEIQSIFIHKHALFSSRFLVSAYFNFFPGDLLAGYLFLAHNLLTPIITVGNFCTT